MAAAKRKKRRRLEDQEKIDITLARIKALQENGDWPSNVKLGADFERHHTQIPKAFKAAFRDGLVKAISAAPPPRPPALAHDSGGRLLGAFERFDLRDAIVIQKPPSGVPAGFKTFGRPDDGLHWALGAAMADFLERTRIIDTQDVIAIGSGRGVGYSAENLTNYAPAFRAVDVTVMSLTGSVHSKGPHSKFWLDADSSAALFAACFDREVTLKLMRRPLTKPTQDHPPVRQGTWLDDTEWEASCPTHALIGVGILARDHRFFEEAKAKPENREPILKPIHDYLESLVGLCENVSTDGYTPVADTSNYLFYVPPSVGSGISNGIEKQIQDLIRKINDQMLTVNEDQISQIKQLLLVAAGPEEKAPAILELLTNKQYNVRALCTDKATAKWLVRHAPGRYRGIRRSEKKVEQPVASLLHSTRKKDLLGS